MLDTGVHSDQPLLEYFNILLKRFIGGMDPRCKICVFMGKTDPDSPKHKQQVKNSRSRVDFLMLLAL